MYNVFISYSTKDLHIAKQIKSILENIPSVKVFLAEYSIKSGECLSDNIFEAIKNCDLYLLLWSKNSENSSWVSSEIGAAKVNEKPILPIILDKESENNLPSFIKDIKYIQAYNDSNRATDELYHIVSENSRDKEFSNLILLGVGAVVLYSLFKK